MPAGRKCIMRARSPDSKGDRRGYQRHGGFDGRGDRGRALARGEVRRLPVLHIARDRHFPSGVGDTLHPGRALRVLQGLPYTLISLVLGWWGIPWGLIFTPAAIFTNLCGGKDVTQDVLATVDTFARSGAGAPR
jgi:hypothetical protein